MDDMEEANLAAAGVSIGRRRRRQPPHMLVPDTNRRRRRRFDFDLQIVLVEAPPSKRACIPASIEAMQSLLREVTAPSGGDSECAICLQDFHAQEKLRAMPCSHTFHKHCIFEWLRRNAVCPLCRHQLMMPTTPPTQVQQQQQERRTTRGRSISAYHFDDDEDYVASLGDAVVIHEIEQMDEQELAEVEERRISAALVDQWINSRRERERERARENQNQLQTTTPHSSF